MAAKYRKFSNRKRPRRRGTAWILALVFLLMLFGSSWLTKMLYPYPFRDIVEKQASQYALDPLLVAAVIKTESNFKPDAISSKGARGLMQIMPDTGKWIATQMGRPDFKESDLFKPEVNIQMGCWYLASLYREFHGDKVMVLAAYNGGRGNVKSWLTEKRWDGKSATLEQIPFPETQSYVSKVLNNHQKYTKLYTSSR